MHYMYIGAVHVYDIRGPQIFSMYQHTSTTPKTFRRCGVGGANGGILGDRGKKSGDKSIVIFWV